MGKSVTRQSCTFSQEPWKARTWASPVGLLLLMSCFGLA